MSCSIVVNVSDSTRSTVGSDEGRPVTPPQGTPSSTRSNPLSKMLIRRRSSASTTCSSSYAGPQAIGADGCPLRSCLKSSSSFSTCPSKSSGSSVRGSCTGSVPRVSFSHVKVREYCREVGDNPSVSSGCPLAIGWKFNRRGKIDIDTFEADRHNDPIPCQRLSREERENILTEIGGISQSKIMQGQVQAYFDRVLRAQTLDQIGGPKHYKSIGPRERLLLVKESAARKLERAKKGVSPSQEQRKLWDDAQETARRRSQHIGSLPKPQPEEVEPPLSGDEILPSDEGYDEFLSILDPTKNADRECLLLQ